MSEPDSGFGGEELLSACGTHGHDLHLFQITYKAGCFARCRPVFRLRGRKPLTLNKPIYKTPYKKPQLEPKMQPFPCSEIHDQLLQYWFQGLSGTGNVACSALLVDAQRFACVRSVCRTRRISISPPRCPGAAGSDGSRTKTCIQHPL